MINVRALVVSVSGHAPDTVHRSPDILLYRH